MAGAFGAEGYSEGGGGTAYVGPALAPAAVRRELPPPPVVAAEADTPPASSLAAGGDDADAAEAPPAEVGRRLGRADDGLLPTPPSAGEAAVAAACEGGGGDITLVAPPPPPAATAIIMRRWAAGTAALAGTDDEPSAAIEAAAAAPAERIGCRNTFAEAVGMCEGFVLITVGTKGVEAASGWASSCVSRIPPIGELPRLRRGPPLAAADGDEPPFRDEDATADEGRTTPTPKRPPPPPPRTGDEGRRVGLDGAFPSWDFPLTPPMPVVPSRTTDASAVGAGKGGAEGGGELGEQAVAVAAKGLWGRPWWCWWWWFVNKSSCRGVKGDITLSPAGAAAEPILCLPEAMAAVAAAPSPASI